MSAQDFLVEIGTEELPPKALKQLSEAFGEGIRKGLETAGVEHGEVELFASPRRLAVRINQVADAQPDTPFEKKGPAVKAAFDGAGNPTKALEGFARSLGIQPDELDTLETDKGAWLVYRGIEKGVPPSSCCPESWTRRWRICRYPNVCAGARARSSLCAPCTGSSCSMGARKYPAPSLARRRVTQHGVIGSIIRGADHLHAGGLRTGAAPAWLCGSFLCCATGAD